MKWRGVSLVTFGLLGLVFSAGIWAEGQRILTVQGRLTDAGGTPLDGFFDITYRIYDDSTGGNLLWTESQIDVPVDEGLFTVELGKVSSFFDIFTEVDTWLETQVEADPPLAPRRQMGSSPHSFQAEELTASRAIGGSLDTAQAKLEVTNSGASMRLRVVPTAQTTGRVALDVTQQGSSVAVGDLNGDGRLDLLAGPTGNGSGEAGASLTISNAAGTKGQVSIDENSGEASVSVSNAAGSKGLVTTNSTSSSLSLTGGDPDFDLLRVSAKPDSGKIVIRAQGGGGDPDFDLLRIAGSGGGGAGGLGAEMVMNGDPDFDLLRISAKPDSGKIVIRGTTGGGDPDFDLLRIAGGGGSGGAGGEMAITGDPDFDLLRLSAGPDTAKIRISGQSSGDPDFDLLRIVAGKGIGDGDVSIAMSGDPDFDLLRMSADADSAKIAISGQVVGDPDFDLLSISGDENGGGLSMQKRVGTAVILSGAASVDDQSVGYFTWTQTDGPRTPMISISSDTSQSVASISNAAGSKGVVSACAPGHATISATRDGQSRATISVDDTSSSIAIDEEGVQIAMVADTGTSNPTASLTISNAAGSKGLATGVTPGTTTLRMYRDGSNTVMISSDDTLSSIAIDEEGVQVFMDADTAGQARFGISEPGVSDRVMFDSDGDGYLSNSLKIGTASGTNHIEVVGGANCDGTTWNNASDVNSKENFQSVDGEEILKSLEDLEITRWNYKGKDEAEHIGPTAQDFYKAFGVGTDDKSISTVDPSGIALAAIKELYKKSKEVDELKKQLDELARQVEKLAQERK